MVDEPNTLLRNNSNCFRSCGQFTMRLTDEEQADWLRDAESDDLQRDMEMLREWPRQAAPMTLDEYLRFLTALSECFGHACRPFQPITGEHWLL